MLVPGGYTLRQLIGWELAQLAGDDGRDPASMSQLRKEAGLPDGPFNWAAASAAEKAKPIDDATLLDIYQHALALPTWRASRSCGQP